LRIPARADSGYPALGLLCLLPNLKINKKARIFMPASAISNAVIRAGMKLIASSIFAATNPKSLYLSLL